MMKHKYLIMRRGDHLPEHVFAGVDANPGDIVAAMSVREQFREVKIIDTETGKPVSAPAKHFRRSGYYSTKQQAERQRNDLFEKLPRDQRGHMNHGGR